MHARAAVLSSVRAAVLSRAPLPSSLPLLPLPATPALLPLSTAPFLLPLPSSLPPRVLPCSPLPKSLAPCTLPTTHLPPAAVLFAAPHAGLNFSYGCSRIYSYYWFMIAMQILSVVALLVLSCIRLLASSGISFLAWFTVLTVLFLQGSDPFLAVQDVAAGTGLVSGPQVL